MSPDLKKIYSSMTVSEAEMELEPFAKQWDDTFSAISRSWHEHWHNIITLLDYPDEIRNMIYTTNAIESASKKWRACPTKCFGHHANSKLEHGLNLFLIEY